MSERVLVRNKIRLCTDVEFGAKTKCREISSLEVLHGDFTVFLAMVVSLPGFCWPVQWVINVECRMDSEKSHSIRS